LETLLSDSLEKSTCRPTMSLFSLTYLIFLKLVIISVLFYFFSFYFFSLVLMFLPYLVLSSLCTLGPIWMDEKGVKSGI
jgi:hypothetical protein